jgi:hypothetical protein
MATARIRHSTYPNLMNLVDARSCMAGMITCAYAVLSQ